MRHYITTIGTDIYTAQQFLESGEVTGIPTETVYGLAANALNQDAVLKVFSSKGRPHFDPLIVHTFSKDEIKKYVTEIPPGAANLIDKFMPGPLTILLQKKSVIPDLVTSGLDKVAIRIPNHPLALQLLKHLAFPLAAPSANPFGYISPTTAQHVYDQLHGKIPYILDGGPSPVGLESTIVGFENNEPVVYRVGGLSLEEIERIAGKVRLSLNESSDPKSPGQLKSHYAPKTSLKIWENEAFENNEIQSQKVGVIAFDKLIEGIEPKNQVLLSADANLSEAAKNLFAAMRKLDDSDLDLILAIKFPEFGLGRAINDRLKRAAG